MADSSAAPRPNFREEAYPPNVGEGTLSEVRIRDAEPFGETATLQAASCHEITSRDRKMPEGRRGEHITV
jgi:hypothetical protein